MKDRISKILREEGMTATKFAEEIGVQASSISHILSGRNKPSTDFLVKILDRFRGINSEWLLMGRGEMFKDANLNNIDSNNLSINSENDLFSSKSEEKIDAISNNSDNLEEKIENTEKNFEKIVDSSPKTIENGEYEKQISNNSKTVDKIVIFFTDNTFESYSPNK